MSDKAITRDEAYQKSKQEAQTDNTHPDSNIMFDAGVEFGDTQPCQSCQDKDTRIAEFDSMVETLHAEVIRLRTALSKVGVK